MLHHLHAQEVLPHRVVVLGGGGFIGGAIVRRLKESGIACTSLGRPDFDLLKPGAAERLAQTLGNQDSLIFVSAKAPCKDMDMLKDNNEMAHAVLAALRIKPVAHLVYISSDAVYKDSTNPLTEDSCAEPGSLNGVMHLTREVALRQGFAGPVAAVRATLVYGLDDPHNGYGPNRFRRLAALGQEIVLFGEGEEQRDHVHVEDLAELVKKIILWRSTGIVNAVSGEVVSFRALAEFAVKDLSSVSNIKGTPRAGPMPHNGLRPFDNATVLKAFPGFRFKNWQEGLAAVHAQHISQAKQENKP
jgi:nucleoside-diphosphate-sugar epimerase